MSLAGSADHRPGARALAPIRPGRKLGYAAGAMLDGVATQAINIFLFFYATAVCGLPAALVGVALAAGLVVDAVVDPLIGSLSDGWRSRYGRRLPFMAVGVPGTMLFLSLMFALPQGWSVPVLGAWLTLLSIGLRVSISLFLLPFNAVGAELSDDYEERSSIAAWRWGFAMLGAVTTVALGFGVFLSGPTGLSNRAAYLPFALTLAVIVALATIVSMRALHRMPDRQHPPAVSEGVIYARLWREVGELFRNHSFRILFVGALLLFTASAIHATLAIHANTYFWGMVPAQVQIVTLSLFMGLLCGAPLAGPMLRRLEKRSVLVLGIAGLGAAFALPPTARLIGLMPPTGQPPVALLSVAVFLGGALMATAAIAFASMMADAADEHEHLFGARREGLYFAGWAFASKAAAGFGSLVAGVAMQLIGVPSGTAGHGAATTVAQLPPQTVNWIGVIYGPGTGMLALAAALVCLLYRLDATTHRTIQSDLEARRAALAAPII
ncbi:MFS transporter [Sphingomonas sp. Y38-1Y]|uniref:MFS transporter n=1 Tax=Sphingomonas sp. Y38-1Y TaxID=3078265 RepID=UPI0028EB78BD|nr:MFS transporter [Sphingomonas sp. Y38-1Y]